MPVDKNWGIMPPSGRRLSSLNFVSYYLCRVGLIIPFLQLETI